MNTVLTHYPIQILGFVEMVVFTVDVLLGFLALKKSSEESSHQLTMELEKSHSISSSAAHRVC